VKARRVFFDVSGNMLNYAKHEQSFVTVVPTHAPAYARPCLRTPPHLHTPPPVKKSLTISSYFFSLVSESNFPRYMNLQEKYHSKAPLPRKSFLSHYGKFCFCLMLFENHNLVKKIYCYGSMFSYWLLLEEDVNKIV